MSTGYATEEPPGDAMESVGIGDLGHRGPDAISGASGSPRSPHEQPRGTSALPSPAASPYPPATRLVLDRTMLRRPTGTLRWISVVVGLGEDGDAAVVVSEGSASGDLAPVSLIATGDLPRSAVRANELILDALEEGYVALDADPGRAPHADELARTWRLADPVLIPAPLVRYAPPGAHALAEPTLSDILFGTAQ